MKPSMAHDIKRARSHSTFLVLCSLFLVLFPNSVAAEWPGPDEAEQESVGIVREFIDFLRFNKKWWLTPIVLVLLLLGVFVLLVSTPAAPFIYTLF